MIVNIRPDCCIALRMIALQSWYASEQELWETCVNYVLDITEQLQIMINETTDARVIVTGMKAAEEIKRLQDEVEKYKAISSKSIQEQINVRKDERERCAKIAETCKATEFPEGFKTGDDGYLRFKIATAIRETGDERHC